MSTNLTYQKYFVFIIYLFISVCIRQNSPKIRNLCDRDSFQFLCWRTLTHFVGVWAFATSQFKVFCAVNNLLNKAEELCVKLFTWIKITFVKNSWKAALDERGNLNPNLNLRWSRNIWRKTTLDSACWYSYLIWKSVEIKHIHDLWGEAVVVFLNLEVFWITL